MSLCVGQSWLLALLAAQKDDRLALLHLGHVHHRGLNGLPADPDLAYAYYANIAQQTTLDHHNLTPQQVTSAFATGSSGMQDISMCSSVMMFVILHRADVCLSAPRRTGTKSNTFSLFNLFF